MLQNNGDNQHAHKAEVSPCIRRLKSLRCMVKSPEKANVSSRVWIFWKSTAGRIGDLGERIRRANRTLETPAVDYEIPSHDPVYRPFVDWCHSLRRLFIKVCLQRGTYENWVHLSTIAIQFDTFKIVSTVSIQGRAKLIKQLTRNSTNY